MGNADATRKLHVLQGGYSRQDGEEIGTQNGSVGQGSPSSARQVSRGYPNEGVDKGDPSHQKSLNSNILRRPSEYTNQHKAYPHCDGSHKCIAAAADSIRQGARQKQEYDVGHQAIIDKEACGRR